MAFHPILGPFSQFRFLNFILRVPPGNWVPIADTRQVNADTTLPSAAPIRGSMGPFPASSAKHSIFHLHDLTRTAGKLKKEGRLSRVGDNQAVTEGPPVVHKMAPKPRGPFRKPPQNREQRALKPLAI